MLSSKQTLVFSLATSTVGMLGYYLYNKYGGLTGVGGSTGTDIPKKDEPESTGCGCKACEKNSFYPYKCAVMTSVLVGSLVTYLYSSKK